jgi:hypothetical protein
MPAKAPSALNKIDEREKKLAPHNKGIELPIVEPTNTPIQINVFASTRLL